MENREKAKTKEIQRIIKRLHLTINPDNYEYIKNNGLNTSQFVYNLLNELRNKTNKKSVFILQKNEELWAC